MRIGFKRTVTMMSILALPALPAMAMAHIHRGPTAHRVSNHAHNHSRAAAPRVMDSARATQIQTALIRKGYLSGAPSGAWDSQTEAAMQKYQSDHGWQTKLTPDSRAIISLGLGSSTTPAAAWVNRSGSSTVTDASVPASGAAESASNRETGSTE